MGFAVLAADGKAPEKHPWPLGFGRECPNRLAPQETLFLWMQGAVPLRRQLRGGLTEAGKDWVGPDSHPLSVDAPQLISELVDEV